MKIKHTTLNSNVKHSTKSARQLGRQKATAAGLLTESPVSCATEAPWQLSHVIKSQYDLMSDGHRCRMCLMFSVFPSNCVSVWRAGALLRVGGHVGGGVRGRCQAISSPTVWTHHPRLPQTPQRPDLWVSMYDVCVCVWNLGCVENNDLCSPLVVRN